MKSKIKISNLKEFNILDHLKTDKDMADYLSAALIDDDPEYFLEAIGNIAKARGMAEISQKSGLAREALYRSLRVSSQPRFDTINRVITALGMKLTVSA